MHNSTTHIYTRKDQKRLLVITVVPDRRRRIIPEVVLVRRWAIGGLEIWRGGGFGERVGTGEVSLQAT
jgi:hypothetical protein